LWVYFLKKRSTDRVLGGHITEKRFYIIWRRPSSRGWAAWFIGRFTQDPLDWQRCHANRQPPRVLYSSG
jgi:hypothetical protein